MIIYKSSNWEQHIQGGESGNFSSGLGFAIDLLYSKTEIIEGQV